MRLRSGFPWAVPLVLVVVLAWAGYTGHIWEDYYITYRAAKNLATGIGLTFTAGERVHSFTSPLGVLLPAAASLLTGNTSDTAALWIFRLMGAAALAETVLLVRQAFRRLAAGTVAAGLVTALVLSDVKIVDYTINGMETPFLLLFLTWTWWALVTVPPRQWLHLGLAWAGLMWTRPDAFVYIGSLTLGTLVFRPTESSWRERLGWLRGYAAAGLATIVLYLPWLLWAWSYYGTPIPHTITAKGLFRPEVTAGQLWEWVKAFPGRVVADHSIMAGTFLPAYGFNTGWPAWSIHAAFGLALLAIVLWVIPRVRWEARVASLAAAVGQFYLYSFVGFATPWYLPPVALLALVALVLAWGQLWTGAGSGPDSAFGVKWQRAGLGAVAALCVLGATTVALGAAYQLRWQQAIIEEGQRRQIGLWLREHARSNGDTVFLEPLGYIGFYSNLKMLDYPGLSSPEVVAARQRADSHSYPFCWSELIMDLQPDWLVLRPYEAKAIRERAPEVFGNFYPLARVFDVQTQIDAIGWIPGRVFLQNDGTFEVYRRRDGLPRGVGLRPINAAALTRRDSWGQPAYDSGPNLVAHAPSSLEFAKPPRARWLSGGFGIFEGAYADAKNATDGVVFSIQFIDAEGKTKVLLERALHPLDALADRGLQSFRVGLPANRAGRIKLEVSPGPAGNNAFDWSYWSSLLLEFPHS